MNAALYDTFGDEYRRALTDFVLGDAGEAALTRAYGLGRRAVEEQRSLLDLAAVHQQAMLRGVLRGSPEDETAAYLARGEAFFSEVIAPFEMLHRGYAESIRKLEELNRTLEQRVRERTEALRESEHRIAGLARLYAILSGINSAIVRLRDREELFREACRIAVEHGAFAGALVAVREEGDRLRPSAWCSRQDLAPLDGGGAERVAASIRRPAARLFEHRSMLVVEPTPAGPLPPVPHQAYTLLPLILNERVIGAFALFSDDTEPFEPEERRLLEELAGDLSFALAHMEKEAQLAYFAYYDALTGLPNANLLLERLQRQLGTAERNQGVVALLLIDLVRFSNINDTYGRHVGDQMLKQVAVRLQGVTAARDTLARMGADRFAVMLTELVDAAQVAHKLEGEVLNSFAQPFRLGGSEIYLTAQVGISLYPNDAANADHLYKNAEIALKRAQAEGERYLVFDGAMNERIVRTVTLETKLRRALQRDELLLHYQPKVASDTGVMVGMEALIRYQDPDAGMVPPTQFVPLLEETGMIIEVGNWVLRRATADVLAWARSGLNPPRVAVNVSVIQMRNRRFLQSLRKAADAEGELHALDIEITESAVMEQVEQNIPMLEAAREMGFQIAIDDFGTGYSSLGYLSKLPVNALKIDRSFIVNMADSPNSLAIVNAIITLAHSLNLKVIAEGVEQEEQAKLLRLLRCEQIQGHLYGKAMPADQIAGLMPRRQPL